MKIDLALERIDHLLRDSVGNFRLVGSTEKRNTHLAALELDAPLEGDVGLNGATAGRGSFCLIDRQDASGSERAVEVACTMHLDPAERTVRSNAGLDEAAGRQAH